MLFILATAISTTDTFSRVGKCTRRVKSSDRRYFCAVQFGRYVEVVEDRRDGLTFDRLSPLQTFDTLRRQAT